MKRIFYIPLILIPFLSIIYQNILSAYPYYFAWDSSQLYATDILLVGSNLLPDHLFHPNMFPFVLYKWIFLPLGKILGLISISSIQELQQSLNPYLAYVEFAGYILLICRAFVYLFFSVMYINIITLLRDHLVSVRGPLLTLLGLLFFSVAFFWDNTLRMQCMIRYEPIGLALWAIATYCTIVAAKENGDHIDKEKFYIILAGFFAGAAFLSKILFIGGIILLPFIYYALKNSTPSHQEHNDKHSFLLSITATILTGLVNILLVYMVISDKLQKTAFLGTLRLRFFIPTMTILPLFLLMLSGLTYLIWTKKLSLPVSTRAYMHRFVLYVCAVIAPLFTALCLSQGLHVLLNTYIYSFGLGQISMGLVTGYSRPAPSLHSWSSFMEVSILGIIVIVALAKSHQWTRCNKMSQSIFNSTLVIALALLLNIILLRSGLKEKGSDSAIGYSWLIISFLLLWRACLSFKYHTKKIWIIGSILLLSYSGNKLNKMIQHDYTSQNSYYYSLEEWQTYSYGFRSINYTALMKARYPSEKSWDSAIYWSKNIQQVKSLLSQVLNNANALTDTIIAEQDAALSLATPQTITAISPQLTGSLLLPLTNTESTVHVRADYEFYLISSVPYIIDDQRISQEDWVFSVNNTPWHIYHMHAAHWSKKRYDSKFIINKKEHQAMFIAIADRYAKGL